MKCRIDLRSGLQMDRQPVQIALTYRATGYVTEAEPEADRRVDIFGRHDAAIDQIEGFAHHCVLYAVHEHPGHVAGQVDRELAQPGEPRVQSTYCRL